jgi:hypothetical protein
MKSNEATRQAIWKVVYYCETMRHGKAPDEAMKIADEKAKCETRPTLRSGK